MNKFKIVVAIIAVIVVVGVVRSNISSESSASLQVGLMLCQTGACAEWGENSVAGIRLAVAELNEAGGVLGRQVELVIEDSAEDDPANSISAYRALRLRGIDLIIGPTWTAAGLPIASIAAQDDVVITSPSLGVADFNEASDHSFNVWPHDELATKALARHTYARGLRKVAIMSASDHWYSEQGNAFEAEFKRLGGTIVLKEEPDLDRKEHRTEVLKIVESDTDVVMYSNLDNMGFIARQLRDQGFEGEQVSILMDDARIQSAAGALDGTVYVQYAPPTNEFAVAFKAMHGREPGITADTAYDALMLYADAIETVGSVVPADIAVEINSRESFTGASGTMNFDGLGGVTKEPVFWQVQGNNLVQI